MNFEFSRHREKKREGASISFHKIPINFERSKYDSLCSYIYACHAR